MYKLILLLTGCIFCNLGQCANFSCNLAQSDVEKLICSSPELSCADGEMSKLYSTVKRQAQLPDILTQHQLEWLKNRDECKDIDCLSAAYSSGMDEINNWLAYEAHGVDECSDRPACWPVGSAMNTGLKARADLENKSGDMQKLHLELISTLSNLSNFQSETFLRARVISALKAQQSTWVKYEVDECELVGALTGSGGNWPSAYANLCEIDLVKARASALTDAIKCIKAVPLKDSWMQSNCLNALTPLGHIEYQENK